MKHAKIFFLIICLLVFVLLSEASADEATFKDVPKTHWAYEAIESLAKTGIVKGFPDNTFRPGDKMTREQFAIVLALTLKLPLDNKAPQIYSDVKREHRSFLYIDATKAFIPTPADNSGSFNFNGEKPITREEAAEATVLSLNLKQNPRANAQLLKSMFTDYQSISPVYRNNVALAVYSKIMSGHANGTFNPKGALTRSEISVVMTKIKKLMEEEKAKLLPPVEKQIYAPPHKPWTIEFVNFQRPDYDMARSFLGIVTSKVYDTGDPYLVLEHRNVQNSGNTFYVEIKTVNMYVYEDDLKWFFIDDMLKVNYDRNNKVTSYSFEREARPHTFLPPVR